MRRKDNYIMDYSLEIVTAPATDYDLVEDLKSHLRLNVDDEDDQLQSYVNAAIAQFEFSTCQRILRSTTFRQRQDEFSFPLQLKAGPVTSVTSLKYYDDQDTEQTVVGFSSDLSGVPGLLWLPVTHSLYGVTTTLSAARPRPVTVEFVAGLTAIPADVQLAIKLLAAHFYARREAYLTEDLKVLPMGFQRICNKWTTMIKVF